MTLSQDNRVARLIVPSHLKGLVFRSMTTYERLSAPFEFRVIALNESADLDLRLLLDNLLSTIMTVELIGNNVPIRHFSGRCTQARFIGSEAAGKLYELTLRPEFWYGTITRQSRIFQDMRVPDIVSAVLAEHGVSAVFSLKLGYPKRVYCVQYNESNFAFVSRLLEQEGIHYFFRHDIDVNRMVLSDSRDDHGPVTGQETIHFFPPNGIPDRAGFYFDEWRAHSSVNAPQNVNLTDFNFDNPDPVISSRQNRKDVRDFLRDGATQEDYPGGYANQEDADRYSGIRIEAERALRIGVYASGNAIGLAPGATLDMANTPITYVDRKFLVVETRCRFENDSFHTGGAQLVPPRIDVLMIPDEITYRPQMLTKRPRIVGTQTAIVTGPDTEEIETDEYGRVRVQFHWDLDRTDKPSSCWVRVAQFWGGNMRGSLFTPRIKDEVVVEFEEGDPDRPIIIGSVYNKNNHPPVGGLPDSKTRSVIASQSSKNGGEAWNVIGFEDKKGKETFLLRAQRNMRKWIGANLTTTVGNNESRTVENQRETTIKKADDRLIIEKGSRLVWVDGQNDELTIEKGDRLEVIKTGNDELTISAGSRIQEISMGDDELRIKVGHKAIKLDIGGYSVDSASSIELVVGPSSIKLTPAGIQMKAPTITMEADGMFSTKSKGLMVIDGAITMMSGKITMIN